MVFGKSRTVLLFVIAAAKEVAGDNALASARASKHNGDAYDKRKRMTSDKVILGGRGFGIFISEDFAPIEPLWLYETHKATE
jgi:hypothetical protein